jgi:heparan-alpha-glucosaminide N-acetyltransferase
LHVLTRTLALLFLGILMVNETPDTAALGWSATLWVVLMYLSAMLAFSSISPRRAGPAAAVRSGWKRAGLALRVTGLAALAWLAFAYRGENGRCIITLSPFSIHTEWYGILGLLGWAYLVASIIFLVFRGRRTALLGCMVLLFCLYPADRSGWFRNFWLSDYVGIGETLGSQAAITVAGVLLASILAAPDARTTGLRTNFAVLFIAGCAAGALLLEGLYGINKNSATPSWCLWACAITAALWLLIFLGCDAGRMGAPAKPLVVAGQNVLLAYLLSEMLPSALELIHLDRWYGRLADPNLACAVARSAGCALAILTATALLNRAGYRLKL